MNLAGILKDAMRRLARKEIRAETGKTKQAVAQYRGPFGAISTAVPGVQFGELRTAGDLRSGIEQARSMLAQ